MRIVRATKGEWVRNVVSARGEVAPLCRVRRSVLKRPREIQ